MERKVTKVIAAAIIIQCYLNYVISGHLCSHVNMTKCHSFVCSNYRKKHFLVASLSVTLRYIIVICSGIRTESNLFQT